VTWEQRGKAAIVGVGFSEITREPRSIVRLAAAAAQAAVADAGLARSDIDGLATYPPAPFPGAAQGEGVDKVGVATLQRALGLRHLTWWCEVAAGMIPSALREAAHAVIAGACRHAVVWRAVRYPGRAYVRRDIPQATADGAFALPYGCLNAVHWHALKARRYLSEYGADRAALADLAVVSRGNANRNDHAVFSGRTLTAEQYQAARLISDPLNLYDCDVPVTGAVAVVITRSDRAAVLRHPPAYIGALAQQASAEPVGLHYALSDHIAMGRPLAWALWRGCGLGPGDMSAAQLYDGFSPSVWYWLEAAGFCGPGEAPAFATAARISVGGELPVNTFGGSLSQGRLHGMGHIAEAALQVMGRAAARQVQSADAVCVFDGSPMLRGGGLVLLSSAAL
jgi:acetyl-CoA acetyltransferase